MVFIGRLRIFGIILCALSSARSDCTIESQARRIRGHSMDGLVNADQVVTAEYHYYDCHPIVRDDLVLIHKSYRTNEIVKQVRAVPGDYFELRAVEGGYVLLVNEKPMTMPDGSPFLIHERETRVLRLYETSFSHVIPEGSFFVFGSGKASSQDSRHWGPVAKEEIVARILRDESDMYKK